MTDAGQVPIDVAARIDKAIGARAHCETAINHGGCIYGCRAHARLYTGGTLCDTHAPQPVNPIPDPTRTFTALRLAAEIHPDTKNPHPAAARHIKETTA